jgi:excisionase family DNA binding protein
MTLKEVAEAARVSESTVRRWLRNAELPAYRLGRQLRVRTEEFEAFLDRRRVDFDAVKRALPPDPSQALTDNDH